MNNKKQTTKHTTVDSGLDKREHSRTSLIHIYFENHGILDRYDSTTVHWNLQTQTQAVIWEICVLDLAFHPNHNFT